MLVLSRKRGERILIGEDIEITILRMVGDKIRIGIDAPDDVKIVREELVQGRGGKDKMKAVSDG